MEGKWRHYKITGVLMNTISGQQLMLTKSVIAENSLVAYKKFVDYCKMKHTWIDKIKPITIDIPDIDVII
jgi:hypothetical protein